jgi:four helix bundle protein
MNKLVHDIIIDGIEAARPLAEKIERRDRDLAKQLRTAASSAALNAAEGEWGRKGHRQERLSTAMNSAREAKRALRVAVAWRYVTAEETERAEDRFDHAAASLWRIING